MVMLLAEKVPSATTLPLLTFSALLILSMPVPERVPVSMVMLLAEKVPLFIIAPFAMDTLSRISNLELRSRFSKPKSSFIVRRSSSISEDKIILLKISTS